MKNIINKKYLYVNIIALIIGIVFGILFLCISSKSDKTYINMVMEEYYESFNDLSRISFSNLLISIKSNMVLISLTTIFSIIFILSPLIIFVNFYKGMSIGFLISSSIMVFKVKGIFYSIVSLFPHHILFSILLIFYSHIMIIYSLKLITTVRENKSINISVFFKRIFILYLIAFLLTIIVSICEIYVNGYLMNLFI